MKKETNILDRVNLAEWESFRRFRFVQKTFHPYACLLSKEPLNEEGARLWEPYRGQPYDPDRFELMDDAWDHEHCDVCYAHVDDGMVYWSNDGPEYVDLCTTCYPLVVRELQAGYWLG